MNRHLFLLCIWLIVLCSLAFAAKFCGSTDCEDHPKCAKFTVEHYGEIDACVDENTCETDLKPGKYFDIADKPVKVLKCEYSGEPEDGQGKCGNFGCAKAFTKCAEWTGDRGTLFRVCIKPGDCADIMKYGNTTIINSTETVVKCTEIEHETSGPSNRAEHPETFFFVFLKVVKSIKAIYSNPNRMGR